MAVTPTFAQVIRQTRAARTLDAQLSLPPLKPSKSMRYYEYRSSMRSSAQQAGGSSLLRRFTAARALTSVAPVITSRRVTAPRTLVFQPSILGSDRTEPYGVLERGAIIKKEISRRAQGAAETKLRRIRKNLKRHFVTDSQYRRADKSLQPRISRRVAALGVMDYDGMMLDGPEVERNEDWEAPEEIEGFRREMFFASPLQREVMVEEMEKDEDEDRKMLEFWEAMDENEQREEDELSVEFLEEEKNEGSPMALTCVWKKIKVSKVDEIEVAGRWAWLKEMDEKRKRELAVMDPACRFWTEYAARGTR